MHLRIVVAVLLALPLPASACSLCAGVDLKQVQTLRQAAALSRAIVYGSAVNARLGPGGTGTTDLQIENVLRPHAVLGDRKALVLERYVPARDPKNPPRFVVFCDVINGKLDPFRGVDARSADTALYVRGLLQLGEKSTPEALAFYFRYLDHSDPEIAKDAFLEFARASDQEVGAAAARLSPVKLRTWLRDPNTPPERLGLYAFLLGGCGGEEDAALLRGMVQNPTERTTGALDGIFAGYIQMRGQEAWEQLLALLRDDKRPFLQRQAALRTVAFYRGWKPAESRVYVLRALAGVLDHGDVADIAIENLRRWELWDLTETVLRQFGKKSHDAPLMRETIVRYALACPRTEAARFVAERRRDDPELVRHAEESIRREKP